ncbi:30S ribosomal protein S4e [Halonotius pteroides]|uniref:Small ribosomal subunit protein eS4 n=1 Tax=Halonotius pteroides TaxID=268735 RepID=A0A3A6Q0X6_9EURY|nr:30S ribosomal protein S4e [Halonotius pteroides]RJX50434.1 30S ribosomal protein S4e [Halonotius pteroides]
MSNHQKRLSVPNSWPVERKTETYTVKAGAGPHGEDGVPLLVLLRDVLGYVDSKKEARYALNQDSVLVNGDAISDERRPIGMFDIIAFTEREEYYRVFPDEGGRLALTPIDGDAAGSRLGKIIRKEQVSGGDFQLTLHDGTNIRIENSETPSESRADGEAVDASEYATNDSLVIDTDDKSIVAHFTYEAGALVTAVDGQHAGDIGEIDEIVVTQGSGSNTVYANNESGGFETVEEYVVVIDENFVDADSEFAAGSDAAGADDADDKAADADADKEADAE